MPTLPLQARLTQAQTLLSSLLEDCGNASPVRQEEIAAEVEYLTGRLNALLTGAAAETVQAAAESSYAERLYGDGEKLGQVLRGAGAGVFVWDLVRDTADWSVALRELLGVSMLEPSSTEKFIEMIHPEDRPTALELLQVALQKGGPYYQEFRILRADGTILWVSSIGFVEHDAQGRPTCIVGINQDITQRRQAELALRESEQQARQRLAEIEAIYQNAPIGLCVLDTQMRWLRVNERLAETNGFPVAAHIGKQPRELIPELGAQAEAAFQHILETGEPVLDFEISAITPAQPGKLRIWNERWTPIKNEQGQILAISVAAEEITERKRAEEALRASNERTAQFLESIPDGFFSYNNDWQMTYINQRAAEQGGRRAEELIGRVIWESVPNLIGTNLETVYRRVMAERKAETTQFYSQRSGRWFELRVQPWADGISVYSIDITERKRAEAERDRLMNELAAERKQLNEILDRMPIGVLICEAPSGKILFQNQRVIEMLHHPPQSQSIEEYGAWHAHYPDGTPYPTDQVPMARTVRSGEVVQEEEIRFPLKDGSWINLQVNSTPIYNAEGKIVLGVLTMEDITARRAVEQALRKSEEKFSQAFQSSPTALAITRLEDGKYINANDAFCRLVGYTPQELLDHTTVSMGIFASVEKRKDLIGRFRQQGHLRNEEMGFQNRDGKLIIGLVSIEPIEVDGLPCAQVTVIDITERKQAEEALRESEARFRDAFANAAIGFAMTTPDGRFVDANPAYCQLTGYSIDELRSFAFGRLIHPEDFSHNIEMNARMVAGEMPNYVIENRYMRKDGQVVRVRKSISVIRDAAGQPRWFIALVEDITPLQRALKDLEKAHTDLIKERNRLLAVMEAFPIGLAIYDEKGGVVLANPGFEGIWGSPRPPADSVEDYDLYKAWWVESGERVQAEEWAASQAVRFGKTNTGQYFRIQKFDGNQAYVLNSGAPVYDAQGRVNGAVVAIMDITDRVNTEKALRENQERFRVALSTVPLLVYTCDRDLRYTWVYNPLNNYTVEDLLGKRDDELQSPDVVAEIIAAKQQALESGQGALQEVKMLVDEEMHYYILTTEPMKDNRGRITGLTCSAIDITEQKKLEIEQKEAETQMEVQRRLMEFREKERQELARDLHDGPIQLISGTIFHLQAAREQVKDPQIIQDLDMAAMNMKGAVRDLRSMVNTLRPPTIIGFGFAKTARIHAEDFRDKHPEIRLVLDLFEDGELIPEHTRLALFRIYQESLNNIVKHAQANKIWVRLTQKGSHVQLQIRDNGQGFQVPADLVGQTQSGHYGLAGMKERAEAVGGKFHVSSEPGKGTRITVTISI